MPPPEEITVGRDAAGTRLDAWLAELPAVGSRARAQFLIDTGAVLVDGRRRPKSLRLAGGERIKIEPAGAGAEQAPPAPEPRIAWEDETLAIVDKPAGLVVHPAPGHRGTTLVELLAPRWGGSWEPHVVHRLDRNTSGLMLIAKDEQTAQRLRSLLQRRQIEREYLALVAGRLGSRTGTIDAPIGRDPGRRTRMSVRTQRPRAARTHFEVERLLDGFTLVRARLETGRTHQIRAHFAAIGHPVCGDPEYGGRGEKREIPGLERQFLHSARLALAHPHSGERIEQRSPLPGDLEAALAKLAA